MLWAAPALLFFGVFALFPIVLVAWLSLTEWSGLGDPVFVGLDNWLALPQDPEAPGAVWSTVRLTVLCWAVQTPLALLLGVWAAGQQRNRAVLSALFFLPLLLSTAAIALLGHSMFDPNFGLAEVVGPLVGVPDGNFLGNSDLALYMVIGVLTWQFVPFHALIYQAAARQIPRMLYEAAAIDGAGRFRRFLSITLPQLRHTIVASSVLILVGSLTYFETVLLLTGGGPGTASRVLPLHMYIQGFRAFEMGDASVLAVLLVAVGTLLSVLVVRVTGYSRMTSEREGL
ncbi:carbohydrate ABC transporter permease [Allonocardiopsis opalescens]|uniref:carbohydrate ABC transporter permease n=1 Tax=Allonocardiopsis opalescens TaxID=1144618 RepID=UPI001FE7E88C|nr:sugar ABC transporter permease [Allonocardiopsis opalescens]